MQVAKTESVKKKAAIRGTRQSRGHRQLRGGAVAAGAPGRLHRDLGPGPLRGGRRRRFRGGWEGRARADQGWARGTQEA
eukprot:8019909-Pyramimonas_sp.AAC.1